MLRLLHPLKPGSGCLFTVLPFTVLRREHGVKEKGHGVKENERARERERKREREKESHGPLSKDEAGCRGGHQVKECVCVSVCVCV